MAATRAVAAATAGKSALIRRGAGHKRDRCPFRSSSVRRNSVPITGGCVPRAEPQQKEAQWLLSPVPSTAQAVAYHCPAAGVARHRHVVTAPEHPTSAPTARRRTGRERLVAEDAPSGSTQEPVDNSKASPTPAAQATCPRCQGRLLRQGMDGDRACFSCGHVAYQLEPLSVTAIVKRAPSHGGWSLT